MKLFLQPQLRQALAYAATGEVAVHLHRIVFPTSPSCFRRAVRAGYPIAHVFAQDKELLGHLARRHGIRVVVIDRPGTARQHLDMCCKPLRGLLQEMGHDIEEHRLR